MTPPCILLCTSCLPWHQGISTHIHLYSVAWHQTQPSAYLFTAQWISLLVQISYMYLWWWKVSRQLILSQNCIKSLQPSYKHKINKFLNKMMDIKTYHIWEVIRCKVIVSETGIGDAQIILLTNIIYIAEKYLKNDAYKYFEWDNLVLMLWRNPRHKLVVLACFS